MADFDLLQTDAQVQSILNDGQSAMGASAQTTLTTEYVMLKDTNGVYHKILKSSFTEAIRDTLAGLLVNNDKGTTIDQIAAIASGDFGSITPANLASVLGDGKQIQSTDDLNNITKAGIYWWITPPANTGGTEQWCYAVVRTLSNQRFVIQEIYKIANNVYLRSRDNDNGSWNAWRTNPDSYLYNCSTALDLASLLGVKDLSSLFTVPANGYQTGLDADNIFSGLFAYSTGGSNFPENWGLIFAFCMVGRIVFQLFVGASRKAYIRIYAENVGWSTWKEL